MLPDFYPDDFTHGGLDYRWFQGVPWTAQSRVMRVDPKMRVVRNPATGVFVILLKLNPEDPQQSYPFFSVQKLMGWVPLMETQKGQPVEAIERLCEGMEKSREFARQHYGETPEQIAAAVKGDAERIEKARVDAMIDATRFARIYGSDFMRNTRYGDSNSPQLKAKMFAAAGREFRQEAERRRRLRDEEFRLVVAKP